MTKTVCMFLCVCLAGYKSIKWLGHLEDNKVKVELEKEYTKQLNDVQKNTIEAYKLGIKHSSMVSNDKSQTD